MFNARIYCPARSVMQEGKAKANTWILEFAPAEAKAADSLMGWSGSGDTRSQIKLRFTCREDAVAYAERAGLDAEVIEPKISKPIFKAYADRFAYNRIR